MALKNNWKTLVNGVDYIKAEPINQIAEAVIAVEDKTDTVENKIDTHILDKENPHNVTAGQTGAYTKMETDNKITEVVNPVANAVTGKLDKVSSDVRIYPGVYATNDTDGTPYLITATSDLSYIGNSRGYIPLYETGGQLKTAEPTADDSAANKGYVDGKIAVLTKPYELIETITLTEATNLIERSSEPDGTAYGFAKLLITVDTPKANVAAQQNVRLFLNDGTLDYYAYYQSLTTYAQRAYFDCAVENGVLKIRIGNGSTNYGGENAGMASMIQSGTVAFLSSINKIKLKGEETFAAGTIIKIYGVRA